MNCESNGRFLLLRKPISKCLKLSSPLLIALLQPNLPSLEVSTLGKTHHSKDREHFLGQIRSLKKENLQLRRKVQQLENTLNEDPKEKPKRSTKPLKLSTPEFNCPGCARANVQEIDFVGRIFDVCFICNYRSKVKVLKKKRK